MSIDVGTHQLVAEAKTKPLPTPEKKSTFTTLRENLPSIGSWIRSVRDILLVLLIAHLQDTKLETTGECPQISFDPDSRYVLVAYDDQLFAIDEPVHHSVIIHSFSQTDKGLFVNATCIVDIPFTERTTTMNIDASVSQDDLKLLGRQVKYQDQTKPIQVELPYSTSIGISGNYPMTVIPAASCKALTAQPSELAKK